MISSTVSEITLSQQIAAERGDLANLLGALPASDWDAPSLCARWRVRDVLAHMTMPFRYSTAKFAAEMARSGGRFNAMADRCARRDATAIPACELVEVLRDNATHPWKPPGGGLGGALTHDVIHGLDITVPLGIGRQVPQDRLGPVLASIGDARAIRHFGTDLDGIELHADDMDWSLGSGNRVSGAGQDLALVICGRKLPAGRLAGAAADRFTAPERTP